MKKIDSTIHQTNKSSAWNKNFLGVSSVFFMLFLLAPFADAEAATVEVFGSKLKVDSFEETGGDSVRIGIFGTERIVAEDEIASYVLEKYVINNGSSEIPLLDIQAIIKKALAVKDVESAASGLLLMLSHPKLEPSSLELFLSELGQDLQAEDLFKKALASESMNGLILDGEKVSPILYRIALHDTQWVKDEGLRNFYKFLDANKKYFKERFVRSISNSQSSEWQEILEVMKLLFGKDDETQKQLSQLSGNVQSIRRALKDRDLAEVFSILPYGDPNMRSNVLETRILSEIVFREIENLNIKRSYADVLLVLSRIYRDKQTLRTREILLDCMSQVTSRDYAVLENDNVKNMLEAFAIGDEEFKKAYISSIEKCIYGLLDDGQTGATDKLFDGLLALRPDPDARNDKIRVLRTKKFLKSGQEKAALENLSSVQTELSWRDKVWFALYRFTYKTPIWMYVALVICMGMLTIFTRYLSYQREEKKRRHWREMGWVDGWESTEGKGFVLQELRSKIDPVIQEYYKCLDVLSLQPGATVREIKSAYRRKMKEVHPDLNVGEEEESANEVIHIRKSYDRLLEMEKDGVSAQFRR